jgi:hypothetical protein
MGATEHRREVERNVELQVAELYKLSQELPPGSEEQIARWKRASKTAEAKAFSHQTCGQFVEVRVCEGCGEGRAGSGIPTTGETLQRGEKKILLRCDMECCGFCGRYKADILAHKIQDKIAAMPLTANFLLVMLTITEHSSPTDPAEYTVQRIWERIKAMKTGLKALWDPETELGEKLKGGLKFGEPTSTGMVQRLETSENAALHSHVLYYGPWREQEQMESILKRAWADAGFVKVTFIANTGDLKSYQASYQTPEEKLTPEERRINSAIREVAKYAVKAPSPLDEDHLAGGKRWMIDPAFAAKYELATHSVRLIESRGLWRGSKEAKANAAVKAESEALAGMCSLRERVSQDDHIQCCCGMIGKIKNLETGEVYGWRKETRPIGAWVRECHAKGQRALAGSRWEPPVEDRGS